MPTDRPTAAELLAAVREHLIENLAPTLEGQPAFHLRVATNALAIVERTMAEGDAMDQAELNRLRDLLGGEGDLLDANRKLSRVIRTGEMGDRRKSIVAHLRTTSIAKLRLSNPRYLVPRD
jgi:hypothetical protein